MGFFSSILAFWNALWGNKPNTVTTSTTTDTTTTKGPTPNSKKAICIAINDYPGSGNDLNGCVNDARNWANLLSGTYGFDIRDMLLDKDANKAAVVSAFKNLLAEAKRGDVLVVTYSGHGTTVPDSNGDEADGRDEAWCLYNGYLIDDEIKNIISTLPNDVKLTIISDSCHSGTVTRAFLGAIDDEYTKARYMPPADDVDAFALNALPLKEGIFTPRDGMREVLISGCKSTEYSYDARINGKPTGAFSYFAIDILKKTPKITYNEFYKKLRNVLPSNSYPQTPQLEGSEDSKNAIMFE